MVVVARFAKYVFAMPVLCVAQAFAATAAAIDTPQLSASNTGASHATSHQVAEASPRVEDLLRSLTDASTNLAYDGIFTYERGGQLEAFKMSHQRTDGREYERIVPINGPAIDGTELSRQCDSVGRKILSGLSQATGSTLVDSYQVVLMGSDRIAEHDAWVVQLLPKDNNRFGVSLAIDSKSHLLLRYVIFNRDKKLLERMQFVSLQMQPGGRAVVDSECSSDLPQVVAVSPWMPAWVPEGFVLSDYQMTPADGHMVTYTDGLASFSLFVKPAERLSLDNADRLDRGMASRGATVVVLNVIPVAAEPLNVAVIGQIPRVTAQKIAMSLRPVAAVTQQP